MVVGYWGEGWVGWGGGVGRRLGGGGEGGEDYFTVDGGTYLSMRSCFIYTTPP